jgi:hypothetical protein
MRHTQRGTRRRIPGEAARRRRAEPVGDRRDARVNDSGSCPLAAGPPMTCAPTGLILVANSRECLPKSLGHLLSCCVSIMIAW